MSIPDIAKAVSEESSRNLVPSKTPDALITRALTRDQVFVKTAPATYALRCQLIALRREAGEDFADLLAGTGLFSAELIVKYDSMPTMDTSTHDSGGRNTREKDVEMTLDGGASDGISLLDKDDDNGGKKDAEKLGKGTRPSLEAEWVRRLGEGEYDALTVRERLDALMMLVHTALDGAAVRGVLDIRAETANALRKRLTTDHISQRKAARFARCGSKRIVEGCLPGGTSLAYDKGSDGDDDDDDDAGAMCGEMSVEDLRARRALAEKIRAADEAECITIRHAPIGLDRRRNRYWCFSAEGGRAPPAVDGAPALLYLERVPAENFGGIIYDQTGAYNHGGDDKSPSNASVKAGVPQWSLMHGARAVASLTSLLDPRGRREQGLYAALHTRGGSIGAAGAMTGSPELLDAALEAATPTPPLLPPPATADDNTMEVLSIRTVATEFTNHDAAAPLVLASKLGGNPPAPAALRLHKLRAEMVNVARVLPPDAFQSTNAADLGIKAAGHWESQKKWEQATMAATTMTDLRTALARLQSAVSPTFLSVNFTLRPVAPAALPIASVNNDENGASLGLASYPTDQTLPLISPSNIHAVNHHTGEQCIPGTSAALALHVLSLDAALMYVPNRAPARETAAGYLYIQRPVGEGRAAARAATKQQSCRFLRRPR